MDPGINKPFDRIAKEFAEEAPLVFLRLLGMVPPGVEVKLEPLRPETAPNVVMPDYVASLTVAEQAVRTFHVEFFLKYGREIPSIVARYGGSLAWQYRRPVDSVLFLLQPHGVPDEIPARGEFVIGDTVTTHPFRTVRLWELDPEPVLAAGDPGLLPWAVLMRLGRNEAARLGEQIARTGNERWVARFLTLGSLRYHRSELEQMLGGPRMGLVEVIMEGSSLVREFSERAAGAALAEGTAKGLAEGKAKGLAEGRTEGQVSEARRLVRLALAESFPGLEQMPELDSIHDVAALESLLLRHALRGTDRAVVERAIRAAAQKP